MPNSILHKRSSTAGVVPHAALLANGEIALNSADGTWFIKRTDGTVLDLRQPLITDGGAQPLAGINADAQDWQTRVIAAGGTVSASTFTAVNNFCNAITGAGIRDRFYRLNLFCGNNLAACLVPLYRGPSLTGTQFGNTTDTNVNNNFVAGDYVETGVTGGLKGNGSNKALRTGLLPADMGGPLHLSVALMSDAAVNQAAIGADNFNDAGWTSASIDFATPGNGPLVPRSALSSSVGVNFTNTISAATTGRLVSTSSRASGATQRGYFNGALSATNTPTYQTHPAFDFAIFGSNRKNTSIVSYAAARLSSYSIGVDMTDAQVAAFDAAVRAFQVALNRTPPVVSNADAQDWVNRVYTAGGTVSTTTAAAVNNFCSTIDAAGIRDRFYRLNLFCGDNLTACLVPLYRGQSLGGTQFGNATDTNVGNNFVSGDYVETGASGGLIGNGTNKYLNTGLQIDALPAISTGHMSFWTQGGAVTAVKRVIGCDNADGTVRYFMDRRPVVNGGDLGFWGSNSGTGANTTDATAGMFTVSRTSATDFRLFKNNVQQGTTQTTSVTPTTLALPVFVFSGNSNGTPNTFYEHRLAAYSVGAGMTAAQINAFYTAAQTFQAALNRAVPVVSNADAQDWVNRVYAAGGTVSQSTADAVNTFCNTINSTGLRDRFFRLNLFCGDNLTACLVPLYRGQSLTGTQLGNVTDTNSNFVAADYVERGVNGGLRGNGTNKQLSVGLTPNDIGALTGHLSAYLPAPAGTTYSRIIGAGVVSPSASYTLERTATNLISGAYTDRAATTPAQAGHYITTRTSANNLALFANGVVLSRDTFTANDRSCAFDIRVFTYNFSGDVSSFWASRILSYSLGGSLTDLQGQIFYNAMQTFQTALNRAV